MIRKSVVRRIFFVGDIAEQALYQHLRFSAAGGGGDQQAAAAVDHRFLLLLCQLYAHVHASPFSDTAQMRSTSSQNALSRTEAMYSRRSRPRPSSKWQAAAKAQKAQAFLFSLW